MATVPIAVPAVNLKFAVRKHIKIIAVICECGASSHGPGVKKWRECPRCGSPVIRAKDQGYRDRHPFLDVDRRMYDHYQSKGGAEARQ